VNAAFDAAGKENHSVCLSNTRVELLQHITDWIDGDNSKHVYWLRGWAGTGKSTIARTIAQRYTHPYSKRRLATFFFSRGGGDAGNIGKFVGTVATQLASQWPAFERALQGAISGNKEIVRKRQQDQWKILILEPLLKILSEASSPQVLLVVDAVDECGTSVDMEHVVKLLLNIQGMRSTSFRIFVTSRPEISIGDGFAGHKRHIPFVLHNIEQSIVNVDLSVFFQHHFAEICRRRRLRGDWPGDSVIYQLVEMSGTLFIWAATACQFIKEGGLQTKKRLLAVLEGSSDAGGPEQALDQIYITVLRNAVGGALTEAEKEEAYKDLKRILGTITNLYSPLSIRALSTLLGAEKEDVEQSLLDLHSVIEVSDDDEQPIRLHHPSFRDFLHDSKRCTIRSLRTEVVGTHRMIAQRCMEVMNCLEKDICKVKSYGTFLTDIEPAVIAKHIPAVLSYACRYWVQHVEQSGWEIADEGILHRFLRAKFLFWLEAMVWLGQYYEAVRMILRLERLVPVS
jgi:NACHT domain